MSVFNYTACSWTNKVHIPNIYIDCKNFNFWALCQLSFSYTKIHSNIHKYTYVHPQVKVKQRLSSPKLNRVEYSKSEFTAMNFHEFSSKTPPRSQPYLQNLTCSLSVSWYGCQAGSNPSCWGPRRSPPVRGAVSGLRLRRGSVLQ